jgi:hypothetical protein
MYVKARFGGRVVLDVKVVGVLDVSMRAPRRAGRLCVRQIQYGYNNACTY